MAGVVYPMVAFGQDRYSSRDPGNERFYVVRDEAALLTMTSDEFKSGQRTRELLVDNSGMVRRVSLLIDRGPTQALWQRILLSLFGQAGSIKRRVACEFVTLPAMSFDEVKARVRASIERNREDWVDSEAIAGEAAKTATQDKLILAAKAAVDKSTDLKELFENLDAAWR